MAEKRKESKRRRWLVYAVPFLALASLSLAGMVTLQQLEDFLIQDPRFRLRSGLGPGEELPDLRITGINRTRPAQVRQVFAQDAGRSLYLLPLTERRQSLLAIHWIRDASVSRVWPNGIDVRIEERTPMAFVRLPGAVRGGPWRILLIDAEGVLLPVPQDRVQVDLPALAGIREDQTIEERSARVRLMRRLQEELGELAGQVSEYDIAELTNVRLIYRVEDRAFTLILGAEDYAARVRRFLDYYPEIERRAPNSVAVDLRLPDRITTLEEDRDGE